MTRETQKAWNARNPEKVRATAKRWNDANRVRINATARAKRLLPGHFAARLDSVLRHRYGLTLADYDALLLAQGGVCAICLLPESHARSKRLAVDHCHVTGAVRGLLCYRCNVSLGYLGNDHRRALSAAAYLSPRS